MVETASSWYDVVTGYGQMVRSICWCQLNRFKFNFYIVVWIPDTDPGTTYFLLSGSALSPLTLFGLIFWPAQCQIQLINGIFFGQFNSRKLNYQSVIDYYPHRLAKLNNLRLFTLQTKLVNTWKGRQVRLALTWRSANFFISVEGTC